MSALAPSYSSVTSELPLLGETIVANFDRMEHRFGEGEALVDQPPDGGGAADSRIRSPAPAPTRLREGRTR